MKQRGLAFIVAFLFSVVPSFASAYEIWVTDQGRNEVRVFVGEAFDDLVTIPTESKPHNIVFVSGYYYPKVYISNIGSGTVQRIDPLVYRLQKTIVTGTGAHGVDRSPNGALLFVTNTGEQTVTIIESRSGEILKHISVDSIPSVVSVTPDGKKAYVAHVSGSLSVIDMATYEVVKKISNVKGAIVLAMSQDGKKLYVARGFENKVAVVDTPTDRVIKNINAGKDAHSVWLTPDGKQVWVVNRLGNSISVIDVETDKIVRTIKNIGDKPDILAFSPDGAYAFVTLRGVAETGDPKVLSGREPGFSVINVKTGKVIKKISMAGDPHGIAVRP